MKLRTFSFRAECAEDVTRFLKRVSVVPDHQFITNSSEPLLFEDGHPSGEMAVEIITTMGLDYLRGVMREIPDSHVMLQTLLECPLSENPLKRNFEAE